MESNIKYGRQFNEDGSDQQPPPYSPGMLLGDNPYTPDDQQAAVAPTIPTTMTTYMPQAAPTYMPQQTLHVQVQAAPVSTTTIVRTTQSVAGPPDYMAWSIINTICCCFICGIVAIVKSKEVTNKLMLGDMEGAQRASREARGWNIAATVIPFILYPIVVVAIFFSFANSDESY